jgi:hypothetical protein
MTSQELTKDQATALAAFIHTIRDDWDTPGITHALGTARLRVDATVLNITIAAVKAAQNTKNRTPAVITLDGDHWREHVRPLVTPQPPGKCQVCHGYHTPDAPHNRPYTPSDPRTGLANVRAAYTRATADLCPHGVGWRDCHQHDGHVVAGEVLSEETECN